MNIDAKSLAIALMVAIDLNAGKASKEQGQNLGEKEHSPSTKEPRYGHGDFHPPVDLIKPA